MQELVADRRESLVVGQPKHVQQELQSVPPP